MRVEIEMRYCRLYVCLSVCLATATVSARQMESASGNEIGTQFGLSHQRDGVRGFTYIRVPSTLGPSNTGSPSIYVSWFLNERFSFGPEFSLGVNSAEHVSYTSLYLAGRGAFYSVGEATSGVYVLGRGALWVFSTEISGESSSETDFGLGVGLGYRWRMGNGFIVRAECAYRRWIDTGANEFSLLLGLGAKAGRIATNLDVWFSKVEVGTFFGLSHLRAYGRGNTLIGVPSSPGSSIRGIPSIYATWFLDGNFSIGPEISLARHSGPVAASTSLLLAVQGSYHLGGDATSGAYILGRGANRFSSSEGSNQSVSETDLGLGVGLGNRWRMGTAFIVRFEGGYRRWLDARTNEFSLLIGLGARVGER